MPIFTKDLDTEFECAATDDLYLGRGVHILTGQLARQSPFKRNSIAAQPLSKVSSRTEYRFELIRTQHDVERNEEASIGVAASVTGQPYSGAVNMKKASKVETSDTQMGVVIECSYKPKTQYLASTPVFTDEARQLLAQSPDAFRAKYGDYFVGGYTCRSSIMAVARSKASSRSQLDSFSAHISAGIGAAAGKPEVAHNDPLHEEEDAPAGAKPEAGADVTADEEPTTGREPALKLKGADVVDKLLKKANPVNVQVNVGYSVSDLIKDDGVETNISIITIGTRNVGAHANSFDQVLDIMQDFAAHAAPVPHTVRLIHYGSIDDNCKTPGHHLLQAKGPLKKAVTQLYDLYNDIIGSPYSEISNRRHTINALLSRLEEEEGADAKFQEDVAKEIRDIDVLQRRRAFMRKVKNISRHDWGQDRLRQWIQPSPGDPIDIFGYTHNTTGIFDGPNAFIRDEMYCRKVELKRGASLWSQIHEPLSINADGRLIVGYEVIDCWNDRTNGHYELANINPPHSIEISVRGESSRGCAWELKVYDVPAHYYSWE
ncbi:hypothetical protein Rhopal_001323-T1 [Rhodotorula paludigena]|uniref:MACPF domain-containing protein n=1 Tax=Rhodotorula paludigena TaxID=86838 RepID=A0AAV5GI86_9BASI|nr:hypothetical protein Rhopal_001323-T1 [Rhodotorula paludigena]